MTDETNPLPLVPELMITTRRRVVFRNPKDSLYYVLERNKQYGWVTISKGYAHSTSCYAKLGRITNEENRKHRS